jgi:hypothetical protein
MRGYCERAELSYALGKECFLLLSMTPYALVMAQKDGKPTTNYAKVLSDWLNPVALEAQRLAARGFAVIQDDTVPNADPRKSLCFEPLRLWHATTVMTYS